MFSRLRSLAINRDDQQIDYKTLLPKMRSLNTLSLAFNVIKKFDKIYTKCSLLRFLTINGTPSNFEVFEYIKTMIEIIKKNYFNRASLTLKFKKMIKIDTAVDIIKMIDEDNLVKKQLIVQLKTSSGGELKEVFKNVVPEI